MHAVLIHSIMPPMLAASRDFSRDPIIPETLDLQSVFPLLREKRVVIVEDEGLTQLQLRKICLVVGMQVVGMATDGEQGVQKVLETLPDIVLMDIKMPVMDGLSAAERILKEYAVCVVMLTAYDLEEYKERAMTVGACGYVLKPVTAISLLPQIEAAYASFHSKPQ